MHGLTILLLSFNTILRVLSQTADVNPAFTNIAPCSCDLTENQYDNNCCCDMDFSGVPADTLRTYQCIPGDFGGNFTTQNNMMCSAILSFYPDWFPLLCVQFLNSPDLGLYYYPSTPINGAGSLSRDSNSYVVASITPVTFANPLFSGSPMNTQFPGNLSDILRFPQTSLGGNCLRQSPVRYLNKTEASCDVTVGPSICTTGSILDVAFYASISSVQSQAPSVTYLCTNSNNDARYVKRNTGTGSSAIGVSSTCSYSAPVASGSMCLNAVASVLYSFTWNASTIVNFDITVTLVNVNFTTSDSIATSGGPDFVLTQSFIVDYVDINNANAVPYSGFPGYEYGLPVISSNSGNTTTVNRAIQLSIWNPGSSSLCSSATTQAPRFGFDTVTGCVVAVTSQDCATLRTTVENLQMPLIQANLVSQYGNPSNDPATDWINVLTINSGNDSYSYNNITGECEGIPSNAVLEFLWARAGETNETAIREIVGARVSLQRETWTLRCTGSSTCDSQTIYSTVTFTEVPPVQTAPLTSFEINRNDTCRKDATCWPELLLPLQSEFYYLYQTTDAFRLRTYNYSWAMFVTFFSIAAAVIPAHWRSVGKYLKQSLPI